MEDSAKWTRRDDDVRRSCAVPGCRALPVVTVRVDADVQRAWIVDLAASNSGNDLCARHADAIEPVAGWVVYDERGRATRRPASIDAARRSRPAEAAGPAPAQVDLRRPAPVATNAPPGTGEEEPRADGSAGDLLDARSPLLARAFAKSRE